MELGFIQNVKVDKSHALFEFGPGDADDKYRVSSLEGGSFSDAASTSDQPWYKKAALLNNDSYFKPANDQAYNDKLLRITDSPNQYATDAMELDGDVVDRFDILLKFSTYFAVRTTAGGLGAENKYFSLAFGTWSFCGDGTITEADKLWTRDAGCYNQPFNPNDPKINSPTAYTDVPLTLAPSGSLVPTLPGGPANSQAQNETWKWVKKSEYVLPT